VTVRVNKAAGNGTVKAHLLQTLLECLTFICLCIRVRQAFQQKKTTSMLTLVVAEDEAGLVEQAQVLTLLKWLFLDLSNHARLGDSSSDIALKAGSGGRNSIVALHSVRLID